ncbi:MAG: hypothetical protein QG608_2759 [Actinomycetota bacterium]|nr:hypothetical protein [Actinomycetota bacterium]
MPSSTVSCMSGDTTVTCSADCGPVDLPLSRLRTLAFDALQGTSHAVMLYGSHARRRARTDSDIDVLQIVPHRPRSYSQGPVNVTAYTSEHLTELASRGSLFVRHLSTEGRILQDTDSVMERILDAYRPPRDYTALRKEVAVALHALRENDFPEGNVVGAVRLARYLTRTALYITGAEDGVRSFDVDDLTHHVGAPQMSLLLRCAGPQDPGPLVTQGLSLLGNPPKDPDMPRSLVAITIWSLDRYPTAASLLECLLAGEAAVDYSALTLPFG